MAEPASPKQSLLDGRVLGSPFYVLRGAMFVWKNRVLWKLAAAPLMISALVLTLGYVLLYYFLSDMVHGVMSDQWYWRIVYYVLAFLVGVLLLVLFFFLFTRVASALAAPFNEVISERTEQIATGVASETPFSFAALIKDSARGIAHAFKILAVYVALLVAALLLWLIPAAGPVLFSAATILISSYMFAYEYLGYPMDRRRYSFREKRRFLRTRLKSALGFGVGNLVVASIPLVNVLLIPAAVAGGTLLFLELEPPLTEKLDEQPSEKTGSQ
ncbi:MAG: EI24 domain-containing protein [Desulfomonile sp.]|nr:EI24 domain-containing protein [Desulfomonile sp.]